VTAVKVVDASAVAAMLFGEPEGVAVGAELEGASLAAPALLVFEIGNICIKKLRRFPEKRSATVSALGLFARMNIDLAEVDLIGVTLLADQSGLSAYDASYLWLARNLNAELVTLDRRLAAAAGQIRFV
jgi:predicted nucleic acid-binding protein